MKHEDQISYYYVLLLRFLLWYNWEQNIGVKETECFVNHVNYLTCRS